MTLETKKAVMIALSYDRRYILDQFNADDFISYWVPFALRCNLDATYEVYAMATDEETEEKSAEALDI